MTVNKHLKATDAEIAEVELDRKFEELYDGIEEADNKIEDVSYRQDDFESDIDLSLIHI